jgi:hypothetical protein
MDYEGWQHEKQLQPIEKELPSSMGGKSSLGLPLPQGGKWFDPIGPAQKQVTAKSKLKHPLAAGIAAPTCSQKQESRESSCRAGHRTEPCGTMLWCPQSFKVGKSSRVDKVPTWWLVDKSVD